MPNFNISNHDLKLAWSRVKNDHNSRTFITHPFEINMIENDFENWIQILLQEFNDQKYSPSTLYICDIPKGNGLLRTGSHLSINDAVIYYALIGISMNKIYDCLQWSQGRVDFSYQLNPDYNHVDWTKNRFKCWNQFREKSIEAIEEDVNYVIIADIAGYYDNINISILSSDLRQISVSNELVSYLSKCLNKWAITDGRGIPQGTTASDILAKLYLNTLDLHFQTLNIQFLRYVDDIRIFCKSQAEARKALIELSSCLRKRGLNLQSAKTKIYKLDEARKIIDGIHPTLETIKDEFISEIRSVIITIGPYATITEISEEIEDQEVENSVEVLIRAFETYITNFDYFDTSLFHFLLNRLGVLRSDHAQNFCLQLLYSKPEETNAIIGYFEKLGNLESIQDDILNFLQDEAAVYYYQKYVILKSYYENKITLNDRFVTYIRNQAYNNSNPFYLKSICFALLKDYTNVADLEKLQRTYSYIRNNLEQAEIIICLKGLEQGRRNQIYSQYSNDGFYTLNAVQMVKKNKF